jgi:hypothetical protein
MDNTMVEWKRTKRQSIIYKTLHRKLDWATRTPLNSGATYHYIFIKQEFFSSNFCQDKKPFKCNHKLFFKGTKATNMSPLKFIHSSKNFINKCASTCMNVFLIPVLFLLYSLPVKIKVYAKRNMITTATCR